jgi:hypothetical protein
LHSLVIVQETNGRSEDHKPSKTPELVQLVGWSQKCDSFLLVYEYMPNGSLGYHLLRMHCVIWRNAAHPVVLPRPEDPLDLDENTLHNLDWNSIIKELGLHDDPGPTLKNVLQFNPCEPQVPHHLPELPHSQHFDPSQFAHRVTVVVPEEYVVESRLIKEKLSQFAQELKIGLLSHLRSTIFQSCQIHRRQKTAMLLSPTIFRRLSSNNRIATFFNDL